MNHLTKLSKRSAYAVFTYQTGFMVVPHIARAKAVGNSLYVISGFYKEENGIARLRYVDSYKALKDLENQVENYYKNQAEKK